MSHKRGWFVSWMSIALPIAMLGTSLMLAPRAHAQDPDIRAIAPVVMIVLDTSGSMEGKAGCQCPGNPDSNLCEECYPDCTAMVPEKNRWTMAVEALTGTFQNFSCERLERTDSNVFTYDQGYFAPHFTVPLPEQTCSMSDRCDISPLGARLLGTMADCSDMSGGDCFGRSNQDDNGVLDMFFNNARFGLMTFDSMYTYRGASTLVLSTEFNDNRSAGPQGMFSYGGPQDLTYPNCVGTYRVDTGVRSDLLERDDVINDGRLISAGSNSAPFTSINQQIQAALLETRPFGSTPIAAALHDLGVYLTSHPDMTEDVFSACRDRYAVLITDGVPDDDFRAFGCDQPGYSCPYPLPEDQAGILRCGGSDPTCSSGGTEGTLNRLFVVGLDVTEPDARQRLNDIAERGGNPLDPDTNDYALFASDANSIRDLLSEVVADAQRNAISRTAPVIATGRSGRVYRLNSAFDRPGNGLPWRGILERQPLACSNDPLVPAVDPDLTDEDRFHEVLNNNSSRVLFSALPTTSILLPSQLEGNLLSTDGGGPTALCGSNPCPCAAFGGTTPPCATNGTPVTSFHTGQDVDLPAFNAVVDWVHGAAGTPRENMKLGAIYHSTPVVVESARYDLSDSAFNEFRGDAGNAIARRPHVVYVGTNDGILHAFLLEEDPLLPGVPAGAELWGFIPPMLLNKLPDAMTSQQLMVDGTPVVKNVVLPSSVANGPPTYGTLLVSGMRQGARGYVALDVTDPRQPEFLWQFTGTSSPAEMGYTYGRAAMAQMVANFQAAGVPTAGAGETNRAVVLLPGGTGSELPGACPAALVAGTTPYTSMLEGASGPAPAIDHRAEVRCWGDQGRYLYVLDAKTGFPIKTFGPSIFRSPIIGTPVVFNGQDGAVATRAFVSDADGVIWRIDFSNPDPDLWDLAPFHDTAWDLPFNAGQPGYEPPVVSIDEQNRVVLVYGSGNTDNFENPTAENRVVSLTEYDTDPDDPDADSVKAIVNWEHRLLPSEQVTGPIVLFEGVAMFATFRSVAVLTDPCGRGNGYLHALHYTRAAEAMNTSVPATPTPLLVDMGDSFTVFNVPLTEPSPFPDMLIMGLSLAQRPVCGNTDTYTGYAPDGWSDMPGGLAAGPPVYEIVANTATQTPLGGSEIGSIRQTVSFRPRTRVTSWAGSAD